MNAVIAYLGSIKPLDVLECAYGTPLTIEVHVIHTYPPEVWGVSFRIAPEQEYFCVPSFGDIGTACERGDAASD